MKLAPLLAAMSQEDLDRLALEHVRTDEKLPRPQLCNLLEGSLRSYRFIHDFVVNRQPPTFALLTLLLDAPSHQIPVDELREKVEGETRRLSMLIDSGDLLARDDQLRIYRRALYEARRNDLDLNSSEAAVLGALRQAMDISQVEHFLIEHHRDLREFWEKDDAFLHEENALTSAGIVFRNGAHVLVPDDTVPAIWQTLGIEMPSDSARRLFSYLGSGELADALHRSGSRTSGSKEARLERLLLERVQPRAVLRSVGLTTLRDICRETGATAGGNKDDLVERIIDHFALRKDQRAEEPTPPPRQEPRALEPPRFETLFNALTQQELTDILRRFPDLRQTGTKEMRIKTLWTSHLSEHTLLEELMNRDLENVLYRMGLRLGGSKSDRIDRIVEYFASAPSQTIGQTTDQAAIASPGSEIPTELAADILANQESFRLKASNPQASLQPWLDKLLEASGLVRCYATEDPNPTKQLKNKLSQAAAARDGLLVLLLVDESAFAKAKGALVERWMTNDEWPKSIAAVALAHPLAHPSITTVVQQQGSRWGSKVARMLFPAAQIHDISNPINIEERLIPTQQCPRCGGETPSQARFCPSCGSSMSESSATAG